MKCEKEFRKFHLDKETIRVILIDKLLELYTISYYSSVKPLIH